MEFIGQDIIIRELDYLLTDIKNGNNYNILFRAPSGYGKTYLSLLCLNYLGLGESVYYVPNYKGEIGEIDEKKRYHFIDEVHILINPEILYPIMDSRKYTFILASNESGNLKEPLINRCIPFIFSKYTIEELMRIVKIHLRVFNIGDEFANIIATHCKNNPRIIKITCERLCYIMRVKGIPRTAEGLLEILENIMYVKAGGLNRLDEIYINYLRRIGGKGSLGTISSGTGLDKNLILTEIEPLLLNLGVIKITSKGREIC
jgi:Holliday junction resolvasome RuvABC ATP-dependent DNA helicase subunit